MAHPEIWSFIFNISKMAELEFDKEAAQRLLAVYNTPDIIQQRTEVLNTINLEVGENVLDVGSGPGFLAHDIAKIIGVKGAVCGVDISEPLISAAKSHNKDLPTVSFNYGEATDLKFGNEEFDTVISTQVLEYVQNVDLALKEFNRVLKKGGKIVILDTDWDSIVWNSSDRTRMSRILKVWESHVTDPFLPRTLAAKMTNTKFKIDTIKTIPILNSKFDPNTYSNRMIDFIVPFVTKQGNVTPKEAITWSEELRNNKETYFFSLNRYLFIGTKI